MPLDEANTAAPPFDREAVAAHVTLLHELASGCSGCLVFTAIWEGKKSRPQRFRVGDVDTMIDAIMDYDGVAGVNIYAPYATMRADLAVCRKGSERDVCYSLAAIEDVDNDKQGRATIPLEASYVVESSPGNFQRVHVFDRPLAANEAKPVLTALNAATGGDAGEKDISHVWRVPGTLNWPTAAKLARGRSSIPAPVTVAKALNGVRANPAEILALAPVAAPKKAKRARKAQPPPDTEHLASALKAVPGADDRGTWVRIGAALHTAGEREAWDEWSKTSAKYDPADQERVWRSFDADREEKVTLGTVYGAARDAGWTPPEGAFVRSDNGAILRGHPANIALAIAKLGVTLRRNVFTNQTEIEGLPDFGPLLDDAGAVRIWLTIHAKFGFLPLKELFEDVLINEAHRGRYHPVRAYLDGLKWDGKPRLATWLADYLGAVPSEYVAEIGKCFLISMVVRIRRPGCKVDYVLVLEGQQGQLKSAVCEALAGEWFSDSLPDVRDHKDVAQHLRGKWLIEVSELSAMTKAETNTLKAFITRTSERYRPSYGRREVTEPRECVFIGTINQGQYLRDATGGRRFWPVLALNIRLEALKVDRDQLFAEAVECLQKGDNWWPDPRFEAQHIKDEQAARFIEDPWSEPIEAYLARLKVKRATVTDVARDALQLEWARTDTRTTLRIVEILTRSGWAQRRTGKARWYEPKDKQEDETP